MCGVREEKIKRVIPPHPYTAMEQDPNNRDRPGFEMASDAVKFALVYVDVSRRLEEDPWDGVDAIAPATPEEREKTPELPEAVRAEDLVEEARGWDGKEGKVLMKAAGGSYGILAKVMRKEAEAMGKVRWWFEVSPGSFRTASWC